LRRPAAEEVIARLRLQPLAAEGGFYAETYRAAEVLPAASLPARYAAPRSLATAIYYLLTPSSHSALHRLRSDEVYHFYLGDAVELLTLHPDGSGELLVLGHDLEAGQRPQHVVPLGTWQGSRLLPGGEWALLGTTMAPGYDRADFELADAGTLAAAYPRFAPLIGALAPRNERAE
jgi:uncharacterized protein